MCGVCVYPRHLVPNNNLLPHKKPTPTPSGTPPKKPTIEYETVMLPKKKTAKLPLTVGGPGWVLGGMDAAQLKASRAVMAALRARDDAKRDTAKAKNDLEAYIISTKGQLEGDEGWHKVCAHGGVRMVVGGVCVCVCV